MLLRGGERIADVAKRVAPGVSPAKPVPPVIATSIQDLPSLYCHAVRPLGRPASRFARGAGGPDGSRCVLDFASRHRKADERPFAGIALAGDSLARIIVVVRVPAFTGDDARSVYARPK